MPAPRGSCQFCEKRTIAKITDCRRSRSSSAMIPTSKEALPPSRLIHPRYMGATCDALLHGSCIISAGYRDRSSSLTRPKYLCLGWQKPRHPPAQISRNWPCFIPKPPVKPVDGSRDLNCAQLEARPQHYGGDGGVPGCLGDAILEGALWRGSGMGGECRAGFDFFPAKA